MTKRRSKKGAGKRGEQSLLRKAIQLLEKVLRVAAPIWKQLAGSAALIGLLVVGVRSCTRYVFGPTSAEVKQVAAILQSDADSTKRRAALLTLQDVATYRRPRPVLFAQLIEFVRYHRELKTSCPTNHNLSKEDREVISLMVRLTQDMNPDAGFAFYRKLLRVKRPDSLRLESLDLTGARFDRADLRGAILTGSCLAGVHFNGALLDDAALDSATLDSARFDGASMHRADLTGVKGKGVVFREADLADARFDDMQLYSSSFVGANLSCANFANGYGQTLNFNGAFLDWAFIGADTLMNTQPLKGVYSMKGAYVIGIYGLSDQDYKHAAKSGAVLGTVDQEKWAETRDQKLLRDSACYVSLKQRLAQAQANLPNP